MNCRDLKELLSAYADGELSHAQREFVEEHLASCLDCRATLEGYRAVSRKLTSLREISTLSDIKETTMLKIKGEHASKPIQRWLRPALVAIPIVAILIALTVLQPWSSFPGTQSVMAKAYAATERLQSYRMWYNSIKTTYKGETAELTLDSEFVAPDRYHVKMIENGEVIESILVDNKPYVKSGSISKNTVFAMARSSSSFLSRAVTLKMLDSLINVEKLPDEKMDDAECFHYRGVVDMNKQIEEAKAGLNPSDPDYARMITELEQMRQVKDNVEFWIGKEDYLIRQTEQSYQLPAEEKGQWDSYTLILKNYDFNKPITIDPPLDAQGNLLPDWQIAGSITPGLKQPVFGVNLSDSIGAEPGYNDAAHQQITFRINITNQSSETVKNVRIMLSTLATNEAQKPQVIQAEPENTGHLDFEPDQSEIYNITWKFDGSNTSKQEISRLVDETTVMVKFTTQDGRELTQLLYPNVPYPTAIPPSSPPA